MANLPVPDLPNGWQALELLSESSDESVWRVCRADRSAVLRLVSPSLAERWRGEIDALSRGAGQGIAGLIEFAALRDGRLALWREWVPGQPLAEWARGRTPRELAALVVELCVALDGLHSRGGVHGDLKPANVIVTPEGVPVLTDLGLGGGGRARAAGGGTLLGIAPECLRGEPADRASDLFALGSMLFGLLAGRLPNPREFYARFPAEDFATAAGIPLDELPEWSRSVVAGLLDREPSTRSSSALKCADDMAARAGIPAPVAQATPVRWLPLTDREDWVDNVRRALRDGRSQHWRLPAGEDAAALTRALRLELVTQAPEFFDLEQHLESGAPVLRWGETSISCTSFEAELERSTDKGAIRPLPPHTEDSVRRVLASELTPGQPGADQLFAHLVRAGGGADSIDRELLRLQRRGALIPGPRGWSFEPSALAAGRGGDALEKLERERLYVRLASLRENPNAWEDARAESRRLCEDGRAQRALSWLNEIREALGDDYPRALQAEEAVAWAEAGRESEAERILAELSADEDPVTMALELRARGRLASRRNDFEAARQAFARALELDSNDGGDSIYHSARLAFERGDPQDFEAQLARAAVSELDARTAWNLESITALWCLRNGELEEARRRFDSQIEAARQAAHPEALAAALTNRGTLERRAGRLREAVQDFNESLETYRGLGSAAGCARVEQWLGGTLRELGQLDEAQRVLHHALEARERSGDLAGARSVRGSFGVLLADRGHVRAALDELTASAGALEQAGRNLDAAWMRAAAEEVRARIGGGAAPAKGDPAPDPRIFMCFARHARWWGRVESARDWAERARSLSERLKREAGVEEARWILERIAEEEANPANWRSARLLQDAQVLRFLATPPATLDASAALAFAEELESAGRDDRAARLAGAVALRTRNEALSREAAKVAKRCFDRAASGLTEGEREVFARRLLDGPDDHPEESQVLLHGLPEELLDMDALALLEINHRLVEQQKLDELCREIVRSAVRMSGAERGFLVLEEDGEWSFDTALNSRCGAIDEPEVEVSTSILRRALDVGRPVRSSNALDDPNFEGARSVVELNLRSILCMPFQADNDLRGVLYLDHRVAEEVFDERAERLLGLLADQAALAIRQVRRLEEIQRLNGMLRERVATRESELETARRALRDAEVVVPASGLVGNSGPMREVHRLLQFAARAELPTLITGESGTGKELAARAVHSMGPRKDGPFVAENCAALPESLIESELFGAEKGAFTGADKSRPGLFERADGGTLFLDEIGELPIGLQAKLLRVLETGEVRRIGSDRMRPVNFRLVAATNRDLQVESDEGRFRSDLMYRLDAMRIEMPALSTRVEDIPALVEHFLRIESSRTGVDRHIAPDVVAALARRAWPGNVRELANEVSRLCALTSGDITDASLVRDVRTTSGSAAILEGTMEQIERHAIESAIEACNGDKNAAAKRLGISRAKVYQRWKAWRE